MKHIFIIGSHTPYLTALGVINHYNLKKEQIIFIWGRNYNCSLLNIDCESYDLSDLYYLYLKGKSTNNIKEHFEKIESFINLRIGEQYILYIPHLSFFFFQIFATNYNCFEIKFIQEGIIDFCKPKQHFILRNWLINKFLIRNKRIWKSERWNSVEYLADKQITETFAISDRLFRNVNCKHTIIKWPKLKLQYTYNIKDSTFYLFESLVEHKFIKRDFFLEKVKLLIDSTHRNINYVKFHPHQSEENINEILKYFITNEIKYEIIPNEIPFELILASHTKLNIVGFTTSLLFFAKLLGHNSKIYANTLLGDDKFKQYWKAFVEQLSCYDDSFNVETL